MLSIRQYLLLEREDWHREDLEAVNVINRLYSTTSTMMFQNIEECVSNKSIKAKVSICQNDSVLKPHLVSTPTKGQFIVF